MPSILSVGRLLGGSILGGFSPLALFAASEPGGWYDPSDLTTLFQDAAGTTPVTAVEQPVGLVLDKSKGLATSAELLTNPGPFSATTGWTGSANCVLSTASSRLIATYGSTDTFYQAVTVEAGKWYFASATLKRDSGTGTAFMNFRDGTTLAATVVGNWTSTGTTSSSDVRLAASYYAASSGTIYLHFPCSTTGSTVVSMSAISTKTISGSHLSQSTSTARPVLSARVNLLTYSETLSNAVWGTGAISGGTRVNGSVSLSSNEGFAYIWRTDVPVTSAECTLSFDVTCDQTISSVPIRAAGTTNVSALVDLVANVPKRVTFTGYTFSGNTVQFGLDARDAAVPGGSNETGYTVTFNKIDLRPSNAGVGLPAYQRVGAATYGVTNPTPASGNPDYDTTGFPLYLKFDGTDDFLVSGTINPGSVDKAQVFAGVRRMSDAAWKWFVQYGSVAPSNQSFGITMPDDPNVGNTGFYARGTSTVLYSPTGNASPKSLVVASLIDLAGASKDTTIIPRINGTVSQSGGSGTTSGGGNFGSYAIGIGASTSSPNAQLYSLILRFSATNMDAATIASTETWVNGKTKAF